MRPYIGDIKSILNQGIAEVKNRSTMTYKVFIKFGQQADPCYLCICDPFNTITSINGNKENKFKSYSQGQYARLGMSCLLTTNKHFNDKVIHMKHHYFLYDKPLKEDEKTQIVIFIIESLKNDIEVKINTNKFTDYTFNKEKEFLKAAINDLADKQQIAAEVNNLNDFLIKKKIAGITIDIPTQTPVSINSSTSDTTKAMETSDETGLLDSTAATEASEIISIEEYSVPMITTIKKENEMEEVPLRPVTTQPEIEDQSQMEIEGQKAPPANVARVLRFGSMEQSYYLIMDDNLINQLNSEPQVIASPHDIKIKMPIGKQNKLLIINQPYYSEIANQDAHYHIEEMDEANKALILNIILEDTQNLYQLKENTFLKIAQLIEMLKVLVSSIDELDIKQKQAGKVFDWLLTLHESFKNTDSDESLKPNIKHYIQLNLIYFDKLCSSVDVLAQQPDTFASRENQYQQAKPRKKEKVSKHDKEATIADEQKTKKKEKTKLKNKGESALAEVFYRCPIKDVEENKIYMCKNRLSTHYFLYKIKKLIDTKDPRYILEHTSKYFFVNETALNILKGQGILLSTHEPKTKNEEKDKKRIDKIYTHARYALRDIGIFKQYNSGVPAVKAKNATQNSFIEKDEYGAFKYSGNSTNYSEELSRILQCADKIGEVDIIVDATCGSATITKGLARSTYFTKTKHGVEFRTRDINKLIIETLQFIQRTDLTEFKNKYEHYYNQLYGNLSRNEARKNKTQAKMKKSYVELLEQFNAMRKKPGYKDNPDYYALFLVLQNSSMHNVNENYKGEYQASFDTNNQINCKTEWAKIQNFREAIEKQKVVFDVKDLMKEEPEKEEDKDKSILHIFTPPHGNDQKNVYASVPTASGIEEIVRKGIKKGHLYILTYGDNAQNAVEFNVEGLLAFSYIQQGGTTVKTPKKFTIYISEEMFSEKSKYQSLNNYYMKEAEKKNRQAKKQLLLLKETISPYADEIAKIIRALIYSKRHMKDFAMGFESDAEQVSASKKLTTLSYEKLVKDIISSKFDENDTKQIWPTLSSFVYYTIQELISEEILEGYNKYTDDMDDYVLKDISKEKQDALAKERDMLIEEGVDLYKCYFDAGYVNKPTKRAKTEGAAPNKRI